MSCSMLSRTWTSGREPDEPVDDGVPLARAWWGCRCARSDGVAGGPGAGAGCGGGTGMAWPEGEGSAKRRLHSVARCSVAPSAAPGLSGSALRLPSRKCVSAWHCASQDGPWRHGRTHSVSVVIESC